MKSLRNAALLALALVMATSLSASAASVKLYIVNLTPYFAELSIWGGGSIGLLARSGIAPLVANEYTIPDDVQINFSMWKSKYMKDMVCKHSERISIPAHGAKYVIQIASGNVCEFKRVP